MTKGVHDSKWLYILAGMIGALLFFFKSIFFLLFFFMHGSRVPEYPVFQRVCSFIGLYFEHVYYVHAPNWDVFKLVEELDSSQIIRKSGTYILVRKRK